MIKNLTLCGLIGLVIILAVPSLLFSEENSTVNPTQQPSPKAAGPETIEEKIIGQAAYIKDSGETDYRISDGDVLDVSVWQVPDLSRPDVIVRPDGKISYPLIGDVPARGLSLTQLDEVLTERLKHYVKDPQISVMLRRMAGVGVGAGPGKRFIILGEVSRPGVYAFNGEIRIMEALALAGGVTDDSVRGDILLIRGDVNKPQTYSVNIRKILKKHHPNLAMNIPVQSEDIIIVPRTFIANVNAFIRTMYPLLSFTKDGIAARDAMIDTEQKVWSK